MQSSQARLNILFLPAWYPTKNNPVAGIFVKEHAQAVSLYNDVLVVYCEKSKGRMGGAYKIVSDKNEDGVRTIRAVYKNLFIPKVSYIFYIFTFLQIFKKLLKENWRPDIIHAHVFTAGVPAVILGKKYNIPTVITEHWTVFPRRCLSYINILFARWAMNRANIILPVSEDLARAIRAYGIKNQFKVIPNTVNTEIFHPSLHRAKNSKKRLLFVGLLSPQKGICYMLEALTKLKQKRQDFILDIVGDGPNRLEYEKLVKELGLSQIVNFLGLKTKTEIASIMRAEDFFILPSLWENLPCVLIEAMASGLPVIASDVGGISEMVNKDTGVLISPQNIDELQEAINLMLNHYQDYSTDKISNYAKNRFGYKAVGDKLDLIYKEIISTHYSKQ